MSGGTTRTQVAAALGMLALALLGWGALAQAAGLDDGTRTHLAGLRSRGLYRLAADYCQHRLATRGVPAEERTDLVLEVARLRLEQAHGLPRTQREDVWRISAEELEEALQHKPPLPRRVLVQSARAMLLAEQARDASWRSRVAPWDAPTRETATRLCRESVAQLRQVVDGLSPAAAKSSPQGPRQTSSPDASESLGLAQRRTLSAELRSRLAEGLAMLADLWPAPDPRRSATASEALKWAKPIAESDDALESVWRARRVCLTCSRLQADLAALRRWLAIFQPRTTDSVQLARLELELARAVAELGTGGKSADTWSRLEARAEAGPLELRGEIAIERVLALHTLARQPETPLTPDPLQRVATEIDRVRDHVEGAWLERLNMVAETVAEERRLGAPLAEAVLAGRSAWQAERWDLAEDRLAVAARLAWERNLPEVAFEQGFLRCSAALKQAKWPEAADDLAQLLQKFPNEPRAAEVSLLKAYALGKAWQADATDQTAAAYEAALTTHLADFPHDSRSADAEWMLGEFLGSGARWREAWPHYLAIPVEHSRGRAALRAVSGLWLWSRRTNTIAAPAGDGVLDQTTAEQLEKRLIAALADPPERWSDDEGELALTLSELLLAHNPPAAEAALKWLSKVEMAWQAKGEGQELEASIPQSTGPRPVDSDATDSAQGDSPPKDSDPRESETGQTSRSATASTQPDAPATDPTSESVLAARAVRLKVFALAVLARHTEARQLFGQNPALELDQALRLLADLNQIPSDNGGAPLTGLADLQRMVAESLLARAAALSARQTDDLDRQMVEIYRRNAQSQQATAVYERLVQRHPRDARLVRDFATFLLSQSREDATRRGLQLLQSLDRVHPAGSLDWFENRLAMAESLTRLEKWGETEKLLKKTRLLYPKLGTAEQRTRADSLLRQAQGAGPEKRPG